MATDKDEFIKNFKEQIRNLETFKQAVQDGIDRANQNLKRIELGEPVDRVFDVSPKK